jgi:hypothetical protein
LFFCFCLKQETFISFCAKASDTSDIIESYDMRALAWGFSVELKLSPFGKEEPVGRFQECKK